jgi:hypothetical protein
MFIHINMEISRCNEFWDSWRRLNSYCCYEYGSKCYNNPFFTYLTHFNPSNKIEYAWWQQKPLRIELTTNVFSSPIILYKILWNKEGYIEINL